MEKIDRFDGEYKFLSNFYPSNVTLSDLVYPTVEHAYQAAKINNYAIRTYIQCLSSPGKAKRFGGLIVPNSTNYHNCILLERRKDWFEINIELMYTLLKQKFTKYPELQNLLESTGNSEIIEGNNWGDDFWGIDINKGGKNHLGKLLMIIRDENRGILKGLEKFIS